MTVAARATVQEVTIEVDIFYLFAMNEFKNVIA